MQMLWGFHQLRVTENTIQSHQFTMGCNDQFVDSEIIATGSVEQGFEERY